MAHTTININIFSNDVTFSKLHPITGLLLLTIKQVVEGTPTNCPLILQSGSLPHMLCFPTDDEYHMNIDLNTFRRCKTIKLNSVLTWAFDDLRFILLQIIKQLKPDAIMDNMKSDPMTQDLHAVYSKNKSKFAKSLKSLKYAATDIEDKTLMLVGDDYVIRNDGRTVDTSNTAAR
ncbi:Hypothetical protein MVR_LOCUS367 [uncultured virus]|nr:Hypothetical protein MVR_LOCUS367 [uncultured virus]